MPELYRSEVLKYKYRLPHCVSSIGVREKGRVVRAYGCDRKYAYAVRFEPAVCAAFVKKHLGKRPDRIRITIHDRRVKDSVQIQVTSDLTTIGWRYPGSKRYRALFLKARKALEMFCPYGTCKTVYLRIKEVDNASDR